MERPASFHPPPFHLPVNNSILLIKQPQAGHGAVLAAANSNQIEHRLGEAFALHAINTVWPWGKV
jgi:hypothetical protein